MVIRQRDTALPEQPATVRTGAIAIEADSVATFARDLRLLRAQAGLDYPDMAEKSHYTMRTLASAAGGLRLPTLPVLIAYVRACDGDLSEWEERWGKLVRSKKGQTALPAAGSDARADGPGITAGGPPSPAPARPGGPAGPRQGASGPGQPPPGEVYVITSARPRDARW